MDIVPLINGNQNSILSCRAIKKDTARIDQDIKCDTVHTGKQSWLFRVERIQLHCCSKLIDRPADTTWIHSSNELRNNEQKQHTYVY